MHPNQFTQPSTIEPADASLLRGLATDVEEDPDYVYGRLTAERLRRLADELNDPAYATARALVTEALGQMEPGEALDEIICEFVFVRESEASKYALTPEQAAPILAAATTHDGESDVIPRDR